MGFKRCAAKAWTNAKFLQVHHPHANIADIKIIGYEETEEDFALNCLGWATQQSVPVTHPDYFTPDRTKLNDYMREKGYEPTNNADEAVIDVWGDSQTKKIEHFSLKVGSTWTSKMGFDELIEHPRDALRGGSYGDIIGHFKRRGSSSAAVAAASIPAGVTQEDASLVTKQAGLATSFMKLASRRAPPKPSTAPPKVVKQPPKSTTPAPPKASSPPKTGTTPATGTPPKAGTPPATVTPPKGGVPAKGGAPPKAGTAPKPATPATPPGVAAFDKTFAAWKAVWKEVRCLSNPADYTSSAQCKALIKLGKAIIPQLVQQLQKRGNDLAVFVFDDLDPTFKPKSSTLAAMKSEIITKYGSKVRSANKAVAAFSAKKISVLSAGLSGARLAAELLTDPLFQAIVREGTIAVPNILEAHAKDGTSGQAMWQEMLKQIHAIETHGSQGSDGKHKFEEWLASYLGVPLGHEHSAGIYPVTTVTEPTETVNERSTEELAVAAAGDVSETAEN